jgi:hypothetical protein
MKTQVYLITGTAAVCCLITAIVAAIILAQAVAVFMLQCFLGIVGFIAIYSMGNTGEEK